MLHILRSTERSHQGREALCAMFAARKDIFVDLLKWDVPVIWRSFEIDQFDDQHATYLILTGDDGSHLASARLLPTIRPHILGDLYPNLCDSKPPISEHIFEITRFCLDRGPRAVGRRRARDTLVTALVDHALANRIIAYSAVAEVSWYDQVLEFGWKCHPLGLPQVIENKRLAAFCIEIDALTPRLLETAGIRSYPEIYERGVERGQRQFSSLNAA